MKARAVLITLAVAALVALGVAWWLHNYKRVEQRIDLPRSGEAATNPLFALRVALEKGGRSVRSWRRLDPAAMKLAPDDVVLVDGDLRGLPTPGRQVLLAWLSRGGHLVVALPPPDVALDALGNGDGARRDGPIRVPLLDDIGVRTRRGSAGCVDTAATLPGALCGTRRFDAPAGTRQRIGDADGDVFARIRVGQGSIDVLGSLEFVRTDSLQHGVNADFAHQLLAGNRGTVHLVHSAGLPSLWWTLLRHGWPVWLPLLLLLAGWLSARMRRFGPLSPSATAGRRSLLEHVAASGQHHWRYRRADELHVAMLDAFNSRLRRRDPQAAALQGDVQLRRLVEITGLAEARIAEALTPPDPRDAKALVARIATLIRMRNRL